MKPGVEFATSTEALLAVQDYALKEMKSVRVKSQGGSHKFVVCTCLDCGYIVRFYKRKDKNKSDSTLAWFMSSCVLQHVNCTSQPKPTLRQVTKLQTVRSAVLSDTKVSAKAVIGQIQGNDGINVSSSSSKRTVYRAMDTIKLQSRGDVDASYSLIPSLPKRFAEINPGSHTAYESDTDGRFSRAFLQSPTSSRAILCLQRIVGLDGAHSKSPRYDGTQLYLVGRNGNS